MKDKQFKLSHLFFGISGLLVVQALLLLFVPAVSTNEGFIILFALLGAGINLYVSIKAIEEVRSRLHMFGFLSLIILEFIVFFAFEYWFLLLVQPESFPTLSVDFLSLLLHSTMIFVFNPLHVPATSVGNALLLINTLSTLVLVLFILQNISQFRHPLSEV